MDLRDSPALPPQPQPQQLQQSQAQQPPPPPQQHAGMTAAGQPALYAPNFPNNGNNNNVNVTASPPMMLPKSAAAGVMQSPGFNFDSVVSSDSKPMEAPNSNYGDGSQSGLKPCGFNIEPARKKRGRPRKYSPDGNIGLGLGTNPSPTSGVDSSVSSEPSAKRRGRPPGSGKKQLDALGSFGVGFTPHVVTVQVGEDIASKIMAFSQQGPRTVCILSASGSISNVTLRQPATSGGTVSYEGRYEIISLSGSFLLSESNGSRSRTGGLSVSLAGPDGRVLGGVVGGMLLAASPVQVIVGSFIADGKKPKPGPSSTPPSSLLNFGAPVRRASPPSQDHSSESSDENGSLPFSRAPAAYSNASQPAHSMPVYSNMWMGPGPL